MSALVEVGYWEAVDRGSWMQTYTGRQFYPLHPYPNDVAAEDIAHALGHICRYGGHVDRFYSVAEHCVLMSRAVAPEHALSALLHDATEAYVGDMVRPLKRHMPAYRQAEDRVAWAIGHHFKVDPAMPPEVKSADNRILLDERAALMPATRHAWMQDEDGTQPLGVAIEAWEPSRAEAEYLSALTALMQAR